MSRSLKIRIIVISLATCGVFSGGYLMGRRAADTAKPADLAAPLSSEPARVTGMFSGAPDGLDNVSFEEYWKVWAMIRAHYFDEGSVSDTKLFYGSLAGMVRALDDPYSTFFDPVEAKKFMEEMSGSFCGIGAVLDGKKEILTIVRIMPGSPAERAGLKPGDQIMTIDGAPTKGKDIDECVTKIRGVKGTKVKLLVNRQGLAKPQEYTVTRDEIRVESVEWKIVERGGKRIAVLTLSGFQKDTGKQFDKAVAAIIKAKADGLILDLRFNPGGYLDTAIDIAGEWIGDGVVVKEKFADGSIKTLGVKHDARLAAMPTIVLLNKYSASASEVLTGALQDYGKIRIVGEKSYGKGCVQVTQRLPDGSMVKLTVSLWLMPKGRSIHKAGIEPDVAVPRTEEDLKAERDPQLDKAFELLTK